MTTTLIFHLISVLRYDNASILTYLVLRGLFPMLTHSLLLAL